jgi:predicted homoserine dehydrogenase-like protein
MWRSKPSNTAGEILDDYGMYMTYGEAVNAEEMCAGRYLPEGPVEGCRLTRDMPKDVVHTYNDVVLPASRRADRLRAERYLKFRGETWLNELLSATQSSGQFRRHASAVAYGSLRLS